MSLLKLPKVYSTLYFWPSTAASSSLVVVLPLVPVMPTMRVPRVRRWWRASSWKARNTLSTSMYRSSLGGQYSTSSTTAKAQPCCKAAAANLFPLNDSPLRAKKMLPAGQSRLSVVTTGWRSKILYNCSVVIFFLLCWLLLRGVGNWQFALVRLPLGGRYSSTFSSLRYSPNRLSNCLVTFSVPGLP